MKRSFYEMLEISRDADQPRIDIAYRQATSKLGSGASRGAAEAVLEAKLLREGYEILSNAEQRARYDAKLREADEDVQLTFLPGDPYGRRRLGIGTLVLAILSAVLGTIVYRNLAVKMDEVRVEHAQSVARHKEEQPKPIVIDTIHRAPSAMRSNADPAKQ